MTPEELEVKERLEGNLVGDNLSPETLELLVAQSTAGNTSENWRFYANFFPLFRIMFRKKRLSDTDAKTLAWKCCGKLVGKLRTYAAKQSNVKEIFFDDWAFALAWNTYRDWLRVQPKDIREIGEAEERLRVRKARQIDEEKLLVGNALKWPKGENDYSDALNEALGFVGEPNRTMFILHQAYGWSYEEIAERYGKDPHTIRTYCSRAKIALERLSSYPAMRGWLTRNHSYFETCVKKLRLIHDPGSINLRPLGGYIEGLVSLAEVPIEPILYWLRVENMQTLLPASALRWAKLAKKVSLSEQETRLQLRIWFAQTWNGTSWQPYAVRCRAGDEKIVLLSQADHELRLIERDYPNQRTNTVIELERAAFTAYCELEQEPE